jgi:hypothetical protein
MVKQTVIWRETCSSRQGGSTRERCGRWIVRARRMGESLELIDAIKDARVVCASQEPDEE